MTRRRLRRLANELSALRSRLGESLPDLVDEVVRTSLSNAEIGFGLAGTALQQREIIGAKARLALLDEDLEAAGQLLGALAQQRDVLDFDSLTNLEECLGLYYTALGSVRQASRHLGEAARLYAEAGADEKARELTDQVRALEA